MKTVVNIENNANLSEKGYPLFLGDDLGFADTINVTYPELAKLYEEQRSQFWVETEHSLAQDKIDFQENPEAGEVMVRNLMSQWLMDSIAARSIMTILEPFATNNELVEVLTAWTFFECLTPDHEVLTTFGWKPIASITTTDKVAQYDVETKEITFVHPTGVINKPYVGKLIDFKSKNNHFSQRATPNHRMVVEYPYPHLKGKKEKVILAKDVKFHGGNAGVTAGLKKTGSLTEFSAKHALFVAIQADGCAPSESYTGGTCGTVPYRFTLKKDRKIERLSKICDKLGIEFKEYETAGKFVVNVPVSLIEGDLKTFDWFNLEDVTSEWGEAFVKELSVWDGYDPSRTKPNMKFTSTNLSCIEKARCVGVLSGFTTHLSVTEETDVRKKTYCLSFTPKTHITGGCIKKEEVDYDGLVHCIEVPTGAFLTRRGNAVSVTGNCIHARTYSYIMRECFVNANDILERAKADVNVAYRSRIIGKIFNETAKMAAEWSAGTLIDKKVVKLQLLKTLMAIYSLEAISFMASFACTFAVTETGKFQGIGNDLTAICKDEMTHCKFGRTCLDIMLNKEQDYREIFEENREELQEILIECIKQEFSFSEYIFSDGRSTLGLTSSLLKEHVLAIASPVFDKFGFKIPEEFGTIPSRSPLRYMDKYLNSDLIQSAAQEITLVNYRVGQTVNDIESVEFDF